MTHQFIKARWGMDSAPLDSLDLIAGAGFQGVEAPYSDFAGEGFSAKASDLGLTRICQVYVTTSEEIEHQFGIAAESGADRINAHVGKDWWEFDRGLGVLQECLERAADLGMDFSAETHRGRLLFTPGVTLAYCRALPGLRLTADYSHFTCVCESDLSDQKGVLAELAGRVDYIHARVGHGEGPQVDDPRLAKNAWYCSLFLGFWREILAVRGALPLCPEFGPPPYMPTDAEDRPVADLWDVCLWTKEWLQRELV